MPRILVATADGLHTFDGSGREGTLHHARRSVGFVGQEGSELCAVVADSELWRTADGGWRRIATLPGPRGRCLAHTAWATIVGTSEARLFRLTGDGVEPIDPFDDAEGRTTWYTPWGGPPDTRSISEWDDDVYVNVHVGGILRSDDRGATWTPTIDIDADVHQVGTVEGAVLAACAGGLAESSDRGATWTLRTDGLDARYSRAVTVSGDAVLISTSNGPRGGRAGVYRGPLAGGAFERCTDGLPEWFDGNIDTYCLDAMPDDPFVVFGTADGRVFASPDRGSTWSDLATGLGPVHRVLVLP
jgi:hypothetical protein